MEPNEGYASLEVELNHLCKLMDDLEPRCAFDKYDFDCTTTELAARALHKRFLNNATEIEVALGL